MKYWLPALLLAVACEPETVIVEVDKEVEVEHDFECSVSGINFTIYTAENEERADYPDWYVDAEMFLCDTVEGTFNKVALVSDDMDNELLVLEDTKDAHDVVETYALGFGTGSFEFSTGEYAVKQCQKDIADAEWRCWLVSTSNGNYLTSEM